MSSYTTAENVQAELRSTTEFSGSTNPTDDTIDLWIQEASAYIEEISGMTYGRTTVTNKYVDYDGDFILRLPHTNIISITKIEYNTNSTGQAANWVEFSEGYDKNYIAYLDEGELEFVPGTNRTQLYNPVPGIKKFRVSYVYGYTSTPTNIQRLCTLLVSKRCILTLINSQANTEGGSIQVGTISISDPTTFSINHLKQLNNEISDLSDSLGMGFKVYRNMRVYG